MGKTTLRTTRSTVCFLCTKFTFETPLLSWISELTLKCGRSNTQYGTDGALCNSNYVALIELSSVFTIPQGRLCTAEWHRGHRPQSTDRHCTAPCSVQTNEDHPAS